MSPDKEVRQTMNTHEFRLKLVQLRWPAMGAILLLAGAGYWLIPKISGSSLPVFAAFRRELIQTVVGSGHAESHSRTDIGSQIASGHRALALEPALILADEPTGNLVTKSADAVFDPMRKVNADTGVTFLMVTHNRTWRSNAIELSSWSMAA